MKYIAARAVMFARESKSFFLKKKKQKTFVNLDRKYENAHGPKLQKFFGYFFSKK